MLRMGAAGLIVETSSEAEAKKLLDNPAISMETGEVAEAIHALNRDFLKALYLEDLELFKVNFNLKYKVGLRESDEVA